MNRKYKVEDWIKIVNKFRKEIPDLILSTDIIVGSPEETEQDFQETINLVEKIHPEKLNVSKFWVRKNTEAEKMNQIDKKIAKSRVKKLLELTENIKKNKELKKNSTLTYLLFY